MFSQLTRWLDRLIPFDFEVEHMPGAKIGLADYLSRHPNSEAKPMSVYNIMLTVAKNTSIESALGYKTDLSMGSETVHKNNDNIEISNKKLAIEMRYAKFVNEYGR